MTTIVTVTYRELYKEFNKYLDYTYGTYTIEGMDYLASDILKNNDPIAYRLTFNEWIDNQLNEGIFKEDANGNFYIEE